jgi:hypothetical protein
MVLTITRWQKFMSIIGNIFAADAAKKIGKYNNAVYQQQAAYEKAVAERNRKAYNDLDRPRLVKQQDAQYSDFYVGLLNSGAEFREGTTPFLAALEFQVNQATDLAISDYNETVNYTDQINQSLLTSAKGKSELYKGQLVARSEYAKAIGKAIQGSQPGQSILTV